MGSRLSLAFGSVVVLLVIAAVLIGVRGINLITATDEVDERSADLAQLQEVLHLLQVSEDAMLGFVITGDEARLGQWELAAAALPERLDELAPAFDRDEQVDLEREYEELVTLALEQLALQSDLINTRRTEGFDAARRGVMVKQEIAPLDGAASLVAQIDSIDRAEYREHLMEARAGARQAVILAGFTALLVTGIVGGAFWIIRSDVSRRQRAQEVLEERNRELHLARQNARAILDSSSEAMLLVGTDSFLSVNARYEDFFGMPADGMIGRPLSEITEAFQHVFADPETVIGVMSAVLLDRQRIFSMEVEVIHPERRMLLLHSTPVIGASDSLLGRVYAFRDVTKERESERLKSQFVSMVSHELRTPLTSVKGYVDLLMDGEGGELTETQRELLSVARRNTDRLLALIGDLLDSARIQEGRLDVRREALDLPNLIRDVATEMQVQLQQKQQLCQLEMQDGLPPIVGDSDRLHQVLTNLISNASKYSPEASTIYISVDLSGGYEVVSIRDEGIGMTSDDQHRLFERFFRAENPASGGAAGTGLGLSIARSLVELQGGTLSVDSDLGVGSTFTFTIPVSSSPRPVAAGSSTADGASNS